MIYELGHYFDLKRNTKYYVAVSLYPVMLTVCLLNLYDLGTFQRAHHVESTSIRRGY